MNGSPLIHTLIINWIVKIGQIPLQNYSSAILNAEHTWAISWNFEISLLYGNFYSGSSCTRFDLYRFPGSSKIPFPWTPFPLRKYSKHFSQQSSQIWIIFNCQEDTPSPTALHHSNFPKMTVLGQDLLTWKKKKKTEYVLHSPLPRYGFSQAVHLASTIFSHLFSCPCPTNSFIHLTKIPEHLPTSFSVL